MKPESCKEWREKAQPIKTVYANSMREAPSLPEALLWEKLCRKQLGVKFRQQIVMRGYIADFYCPSRRLAVEVDGKQHNAEYDCFRDHVINLAGVRVLRFPALSVFTDINTVVKKIWFYTLSRERRGGKEFEDLTNFAEFLLSAKQGWDDVKGIPSKE